MFKLEKYTVFESIRKHKEKGGSMLIIHTDLKPVLIKEYNEVFELIVVEITTQNTSIRVITGYGPQENLSGEERMPFWVALDELYGRSVIIQMDANAKLGPRHIKDDPNIISGNGKVLEGIMDRHALSVINGLKDKCIGTITRQRSTTNNVEKSVIDFILVSSDLVKHIDSMHID